MGVEGGVEVKSQNRCFFSLMGLPGPTFDRHRPSLLGDDDLMVQLQTLLPSLTFTNSLYGLVQVMGRSTLAPYTPPLVTMALAHWGRLVPSLDTGTPSNRRPVGRESSGFLDRRGIDGWRGLGGRTTFWRATDMMGHSIRTCSYLQSIWPY